MGTQVHGGRNSRSAADRDEAAEPSGTLPSPMPTALEVELSPPSVSRCECCGGTTVRLTRFVYRDGDALAVYYAAYANSHPECGIAALVSLGEWGEDGTPEDRVAFFCELAPSGEGYQATLRDAARSPWAKAEIVGRMLSREEARAHPWKATVFEVLDEAFARDPSFDGFFGRVRCGNAAVPLERGFQMPDDVFALGPDRASRATIGRTQVSLDDNRFFLRCLLPVRVEGYGTWGVGLWVEVSRETFRQAREVWEDAERYARLEFAGTIANAPKGDVCLDALQLPFGPGVPVELRVGDVDALPSIVASDNADLAALLAREWPRDDFEAFAVAHGLL